MVLNKCLITFQLSLFSIRLILLDLVLDYRHWFLDSIPFSYGLINADSKLGDILSLHALFSIINYLVLISIVLVSSNIRITDW